MRRWQSTLRRIRAPARTRYYISDAFPPSTRPGRSPRSLRSFRRHCSAQLRQPRPRLRARADPFRRHHPKSRHPLHPQQRRVRQKIPPRDPRPRRRLHRLRQRRLAGHLHRQRHRLARPSRPHLHARPLPQQPRRHLHRRHQKSRPRHPHVRHGCGRRRLRQRWLRRPVCNSVWTESSVS